MTAQPPAGYLPAHVRYIEAPIEYQPDPDDPPAVFLAGGITSCPDWQATALENFASDDVPMVVLNPRRQNFPIHDPTAGPAQIGWEYRHLHQRGVLTVFWFPAGGFVPQPIALFELGQALGEGRPFVVGVDPGYSRALDVQAQRALARPGLTVHDRLDAVLAETRQAVRALAAVRSMWPQVVNTLAYASRALGG